MNELRKDVTRLELKKSVMLISMITMLTGLLFSRVLLSSGLIVFAVACLVHKNLLQQLKNFFSSILLWSMSLLFLLPLISGLWSHDLSQWMQIVRIKLPFLLLPVCFAGNENFLFKEWEKIAFSFLILMIVGVGWSLLQYFPDMGAIHTGYLKAHTIATPLGNDHVRFSLLVAVAILTASFLLIKKGRNYKKAVAVLLLFMILLFVLYLHILAVRTGLVCFYIGAFVFIVWLLWNRKNKIKYGLLLILIVSMPFIAYFIFPTLKNRVRYLRYDLSLVQKNILVQGSNDGNRLFSIKAGWQLLNKNPVTGVGFGDIRRETNQLYEANHPGIMETDKILPSSEWMMYGAGVGWPGFILFSFIMLVPFFIKELRGNRIWILVNLFMASSYLFDIGLEVQYGVFIHAFVLLWWYKWLRLQQ